MRKPRKPRDLSHNWPGNDSWMGDPLNAYLAVVLVPVCVFIILSIVAGLLFGR